MCETLEKNRVILNQKLLSLFILFSLISFIGAAKSVLFNDGSAMAKYIAKQYQLEVVSEEEVEDYFQSVIFGDTEAADIDDIEVNTEEEQEAANRTIDRIYMIDKLIAWTLLLLSLSLLIPKVQSSPIYYVLPLCFLWLIGQKITCK